MKLLAFALLALLQAPGAVLTGVIVGDGTDRPIAGARVLMAASDGGGVRMAAGDDRGRFRFPNLRPGVYRVWAEHEDYVRSAPVDVTLAAGEPARSVMLRLVATGVITGRIVDGHAEPIARVYVRAESDSGTWEGQTNDLGEYRLFGLPPGVYVVSAAPYLPPRIDGGTYLRPTPPSPFSRGEGQFMVPLARMLEAGEFVDPRALAGAGQTRVFYPNVLDAAAAAPIEVIPGEVLAGIDFVLR